MASATTDRVARRRSRRERVEDFRRENEARTDHRAPGWSSPRRPPRDVSYANRWAKVPRRDFRTIDSAIREAREARRRGEADAGHLAALEDAAKLLGRWRQRYGRRGGMSERQGRRLANQRQRLEVERKALRRALGLVGQGRRGHATGKTWGIPQSFVDEVEDAIARAERAADQARHEAGWDRIDRAKREAQRRRGQRGHGPYGLDAAADILTFRTPAARREAAEHPLRVEYPSLRVALGSLGPVRRQLIAQARRPRRLLRDREVRGPDGPVRLAVWLPDAVRRARLAEQRLERLIRAPVLHPIEVESHAEALDSACAAFRRERAGRPRHALEMRPLLDGLRAVRPRLHALRQRAIAARRAGKPWCEPADEARWAAMQARLASHARALRAMFKAKATDHRRATAPLDAARWEALAERLGAERWDAETWTELRERLLRENFIPHRVAERSTVRT